MDVEEKVGILQRLGWHRAGHRTEDAGEAPPTRASAPPEETRDGERPNLLSLHSDGTHQFPFAMPAGAWRTESPWRFWRPLVEWWGFLRGRDPWATGEPESDAHGPGNERKAA